MKFVYNRNMAELLRVMKSKGLKKNLVVSENNNKIQISVDYEKTQNTDMVIPVIFKGSLMEKEKECILTGRFYYGFYLYTLVIVAAVLIAARFIWSLYNMQVDNMVLCGIVTLLLIIVVMVVFKKSKQSKSLINSFLIDLMK